jgi:hypothetical protein
MRQPEFSELSLGLWAQKIQPRIRTEAQERVELPSEAELLDRLGELSELLGATRCATAYQLFSPDDLPDDWDNELVDQRALIRRLLRYAGKDDRAFPVRVTDGRHATAEEFGHNLSGDVVYVGLTSEDEAAANFLVLALGDLRAMFGPTCVEVARALIHRARIDAKARGYRGGEELDDGDVELPADLDGFLACFVLGWGVPVTNACFDSRSVGDTQGGWLGTAWVAASLSYPPEVAARLLAVIQRAGARSKQFIDARRAALNPSQRKFFDEALVELEGRDESLRAALRWGHPEDWPPALERALDELEYDAVDEALAVAQEAYAARQRLPNLGTFVFRARPKRTLQGSIIGGLLGMVFGSALGAVIGAGVGALLGSQRRGSVCSGPRCGAPLDATARQCGKCGGTIVGEIARAKDHLGALEDYEEQQLGREVEAAIECD